MPFVAPEPIPTKRLLLALPQSLFDRASGAAVSMRHMACQLAQLGWQVQLLCTTATESGRLGLPLADEDLGGATLELITLPAGTGRDWTTYDQGLFAQTALKLLDSFAPDILLTYGADATEHQLCTQAQARGIKVVLALHNLAYLHLSLPPHDAALVPSIFMKQRYNTVVERFLLSPPPLWAPDVIVTKHDPVFAVFVNPEYEKGADVVVQLAALCPSCPFLIVEGRANGGRFAAAALACGIEPSTLPNVHIVNGGGRIRDVLAVARIVLMPSRVEEAAGRLAAEAIANGIPTLVSDRGGLPEMVEGVGTVIPWEAENDATVKKWAEALNSLLADEPWQAAAAKARASSPYWRTDNQATKLANTLVTLFN